MAHIAFSVETYIVFPLLIGTPNYISMYTKLWYYILMSFKLRTIYCLDEMFIPSSISLFSSISCRFTATCHVFYSDIYVIISSSSDVKLHDLLLPCNRDVVVQRRHRYLYSQSDSLKSFLHSFFCHYLWFAISTLRFLWESWYIINVRENRRGSQEWTINRPRSRMDNQ